MGHLCYNITDVPPQSNSPSVSVRGCIYQILARERKNRYGDPVRQPNRQVAVFHGWYRDSVNRVSMRTGAAHGITARYNCSLAG